MKITPQIFFIESDGSVDDRWSAGIEVEVKDDFSTDAVSGHSSPQREIEFAMHATYPTEEEARSALLQMIADLRDSLAAITELPPSIEDPYA